MGAMDDFIEHEKRIRGAMDDFNEQRKQMAEWARAVAIPQIDVPSLNMPKMDGHLASGFYERLTSWITDFEKLLDPETEVGVRLVSFGQTLTFHLTDITYWNPFLIRFDGLNAEGQEVQLIQNVSQISILLMRLPRLADKPHRIGFHAGKDSSEG